MAESNFNTLVFTAIVVTTMAYGGSGTNIRHVVGDDYGWGIPTTADFYTNWVSKQIFTVGDTLHFEFPTGTHDVVEVTKEEYDHCHADEGSFAVKTAPATFNLTEPGDHYYICTLEAHCHFHMKLAINVCPPSTPPATTAPPPFDV